MRGCCANLNWDYKQKKKRLLEQLKVLDSLAESRRLSAKEWLGRYSMETKLEEVYDVEEKYWQQKGSVNWITQGYANTAFFPHNCANGRRRKNYIFSLDHEGVPIKSKAELRNHIYSFYKNLLGSEAIQGVRLSHVV